MKALRFLKQFDTFKPDFRQNPLNLLGGNGACTEDGRFIHHAQQGGRWISRTRSGIQNQIDVMTQ